MIFKRKQNSKRIREKFVKNRGKPRIFSTFSFSDRAPTLELHVSTYCLPIGIVKKIRQKIDFPAFPKNKI